MRGTSTLSWLGLLTWAFARYGRLISLTTWFLFAAPLIALTRLTLLLDEITNAPEAALRRFFAFSAIDPEAELRRDLGFVRERYFPEDIDDEPEETVELGGVGS